MQGRNVAHSSLAQSDLTLDTWKPAIFFFNCRKVFQQFFSTESVELNTKKRESSTRIKPENEPYITAALKIMLKHDNMEALYQDSTTGFLGLIINRESDSLNSVDVAAFAKH